MLALAPKLGNGRNCLWLRCFQGTQTQYCEPCRLVLPVFCRQEMFIVKPRVTLGLIIFTILIQKSDKQWKFLSGCLKNLPTRIDLGHQTPRENLMTRGNSLRQIFQDNHYGLFTICSIFVISMHSLLYLRVDIPKKTFFFWTLSKSGLDPPPLILDTREVTFVSAYFGQP